MVIALIMHFILIILTLIMHLLYTQIIGWRMRVSQSLQPLP